MDYLKKLNKDELEFLNQFMAEYVSGAFKKDENGGYSEDNLHKSVEERRECYTRNNTRNRCGLTISNATGQTYRSDNLEEYLDEMINYETINASMFSDFMLDEYDGDYSELEIEILREMISDYRRCINPKNNSDKKLAESNYGKRLISKFKDTNFVKKS